MLSYFVQVKARDKRAVLINSAEKIFIFSKAVVRFTGENLLRPHSL
jgi:hypothetical protein